MDQLREHCAKETFCAEVVSLARETRAAGGMRALRKPCCIVPTLDRHFATPSVEWDVNKRRLTNESFRILPFF